MNIDEDQKLALGFEELKNIPNERMEDYMSFLWIFIEFSSDRIVSSFSLEWNRRKWSTEDKQKYRKKFNIPEILDHEITKHEWK